MNPYGLGAHASTYDIRDFAYIPSGVPATGGTPYTPDDIEHQHRVGICTAISLTQNARKALGVPFSAEFQYLMEKTIDGNWDEGSSARTAVTVAKNIGLLPADNWTYTNEQDRMLPYPLYIQKLRNVPQSEIERLKTIASAYKIKAYAQITPVTRENLDQAILESKAGIICRYVIGNEWWTGTIEPLRPPVVPVSGHLITEANFAGNSTRLANTWGKDWATGGTAYRLDDYMPTEAWHIYYNDVPPHVQTQLDNRVTVYGKVLNMTQALLFLQGLQKLLALFSKQ